MTNSVTFHSRLLRDGKRMSAYRKAIFETVKPGDVILDIGTGSGILSFFACQAGAKHVYAVEKGDVIYLAQLLARENGLSERITFIHSDLSAVQLPEQVDGIVSELISKGVLGQQQETLISLARDRFLKPGGFLLPQRVDLWMVPVQADPVAEKTTLPATEVYDLDFTPLKKLITNRTQSLRLKPEAMLAKPQCTFSHIARQVSKDTHIETEITFRVDRAGTLNGFGAWFKALLANDIELTNIPPTKKPFIWDNLILPLSDPVEVKPGMLITLKLNAKDTPRLPQFWKWETVICLPPEGAGESQIVAKFHQSTFFGQLRNPQ